MVDLQIRDGTLTVRTPVDNTLPSINQPLFIQAYKNLSHGPRQSFVQRKTLSRPIARSSQSPMLILNPALILLHPLPDTLQKCFTPDLMSIRPLAGKQSLHDGLGGNARV